jgi:hypothetical protein
VRLGHREQPSHLRYSLRPVMGEQPEVGVFDYDGTPLEAWIMGRHWCVRFDGRQVEARSMGEALEEIMGDARDLAERRRRDRLIIEILLWSQADQGASGPGGSSATAP